MLASYWHNNLDKVRAKDTEETKSNKDKNGRKRLEVVALDPRELGWLEWFECLVWWTLPCATTLLFIPCFVFQMLPCYFISTVPSLAGTLIAKEGLQMKRFLFGAPAFLSAAWSYLVRKKSLARKKSKTSSTALLAHLASTKAILDSLSMVRRSATMLDSTTMETNSPFTIISAKWKQSIDVPALIKPAIEMK